ncbi:MAG: phasin family protein [Pseudomonadota bacterium]
MSDQNPFLDLMSFDLPQFDAGREWLDACTRATEAMTRQQLAVMEEAAAAGVAQLEALRDAEGPMDYLGRQSELASGLAKTMSGRAEALAETSSGIREDFWTVARKLGTMPVSDAA